VKSKSTYLRSIDVSRLEVVMKAQIGWTGRGDVKLSMSWCVICSVAVALTSGFKFISLGSEIGRLGRQLKLRELTGRE
jgi:hypothetical protein